MSHLKCNLMCHSVSGHVQQLYTGFKMLADDGRIDITQQLRTSHTNGVGGSNRPQYLRDALDAHLMVEVSDSTRRVVLYFDNHDSRELDDQALAECDFYFKRSYSSDYVSRTHADSAQKVHPLGLNYLVFPDGIDVAALWRSLALNSSMAKKLAGAIGAIDSGNIIRFCPRLRHLHASPKLAADPKVLFMVTAYDPHDRPDRPKEKVEERAHNNETRANCVRMLRKELGPKFYGGFMHNRFTTERYKDVLVDRPLNAQKENYLKMLGDFPICVATTGLHGSIGWKLAEYVAFSKAIVSEKLTYEVPGQFCQNRNYLEFSSPQECVDQSVRLMDDEGLRHELMANNSVYYDRNVRPDVLVLNALSTATQAW